MTTQYFLVHHKIFDLPQFYIRSANFNEPTGFILKTAFDCGEFAGFTIYEGTGTVANLKTYLDNKYLDVANNVIYQITPDTSGGWDIFQTIQELKDRANAQ